MGLKEKVQSDIKEALKNNQSSKLEALRLFFSAIKNAEIEKRPKPLEESDLLALLRKQIKIYTEIIEQYADAKKPEKAEVELMKLKFLQEYLPPAPSEKELLRMVDDVILSIKARGPEDQGLVIKEVRKKTGGSADNVQIVRIVRERLQQI